MKIILVGASGTIGQVLAKELSSRHEVIEVSRQGQVPTDVTDAASIRAMFEKIGPFDALICAAGNAYWGSLDGMTEEDFYQGIRQKLMGQINLVLIGQAYVNPTGSFTLTSGIISDDPVRGGVNYATVNGALNAFATAAALELKNGVRINVVSPGLAEDSVAQFGAVMPGHVPVPMQRIAAAYVKSVEGAVQGQVIRVF